MLVFHAAIFVDIRETLPYGLSPSGKIKLQILILCQNLSPLYFGTKSIDFFTCILWETSLLFDRPKLFYL